MNQASFVPDRQGIDNVIICQEVLHSISSKKGKRGEMVIKLDLEKVYDRMEWPYILETLHDARLPLNIISIIMRCIKEGACKLPWNGEITHRIKPSRGLRQGDPLSSYLFVLCIERLAHEIQQQVNKGKWKPVRASRSGSGISHLFFADDIFLFSKADKAHIQLIQEGLSAFTRSSAQKINFVKSTFFFTQCFRAGHAKYELEAWHPSNKEYGLLSWLQTQALWR